MLPGDPQTGQYALFEGLPEVIPVILDKIFL
jgi:hypothetical protein